MRSTTFFLTLSFSALVLADGSTTPSGDGIVEDKYEVKFELPSESLPKVKEAFGFKKPGSREIYFLDTKDEVLLKHGLIVRLRRIKGKDFEVIVKARPLNPDSRGRFSEIEDLWFKVEYSGEKEVLLAKVAKQMKAEKIKAILQEKKKGSDLLNSSQRQLLREKWDNLVNKKNLRLRVLGPIKSKYWDNGTDELEMWTLPDKTKMLELAHPGKGDDPGLHAKRITKMLQENHIERIADEMKTTVALDFLEKHGCFVRSLKLHLEP